jgi:hypothetical protein
MNDQQKVILVIARHDKPEALRMASGLTLLDDQVVVDVIGQLDDDDDTALQMEALEFAEVPVINVDPRTDAGMERLADDILRSDAVYVI